MAQMKKLKNLISGNTEKVRQINIEQGGAVAMQHLLFKLNNKLFPVSRNKLEKRRKRLLFGLNVQKLDRDLEHVMEVGFLKNKKQFHLQLNDVPEALKKRIVDHAQKLLNNKYTLYGSLEVEFDDDDFSWHLDPLTGFRWPMDCSSSSVSKAKPDGADIKTIWELSRFQMLCPVAYAYLITGDRKFALFGIEKVLSWIENNPFGRGPNWTRGMEASIRLINCAVYLPMIMDAQVCCGDQMTGRLREFFTDHLIFIKDNLEWSPAHTNNHYLANLVGLMAGYHLFPSLSWGKEIFEFAELNFLKEMLKQFRFDGINYEGSLPYHRLSTEIIIIGMVILQQHNRYVPVENIDRLKAIYDFTKNYTNASKHVPIIGDNDSGIFLKFFPNQEKNEHGYLNPLISQLLGNAVEYNSENERLCTFHLFHKETEIKKNKCEKSLSRKPLTDIDVKQFDGLIIARKKKDAIFFNTMKNGIWGSGGHTHNDALAMFPVFDGTPLFVDQGCFSYTGYLDKRHRDRSALSHNGPVVNTREQNTIFENDAFYMIGRIKPENSILMDDGTITMTGWYGVNYLTSRVYRVFRKITWDYQGKKINISDWVDSYDKKGTFTLELCFHVNPAWECIKNGKATVFFQNDKTVSFVDVNGIGFNIGEGAFSETYQSEEPCQVISTSPQILVAGQTIEFQISY
jgi:hypothetical protein